MKKDIYNYLNGSLMNILNFYKEKTEEHISNLKRAKGTIEIFLKPKQIENITDCIDTFEKLESIIKYYEDEIQLCDEEIFNEVAFHLNHILSKTSEKICYADKLCSEHLDNK